ncbi:MAG: 3-deoxy-7-phosphoheptulonate synthase, partial [Eubacteriales bacterium]
MIVILKKNPDKAQLERFSQWLAKRQIEIHAVEGVGQTIWGLLGDTTRLDIALISALDIVDDVKRVQEPYKNANRKFHPDDTIVPVGNTQIGGGMLSLIAGPCSVESEEQIVSVAKSVQASGATLLRGGAFKPRS